MLRNLNNSNAIVYDYRVKFFIIIILRKNFLLLFMKFIVYKKLSFILFLFILYNTLKNKSEWTNEWKGKDEFY